MNLPSTFLYFLCLSSASSLPLPSQKYLQILPNNSLHRQQQKKLRQKSHFVTENFDERRYFSAILYLNNSHANDVNVTFAK